MKTAFRAALALVASLALAGPAAAWTRPAHMVTAAIAYDEIQRTRPELLAEIGKILDAHPDHGPFEVAIDRTTGAERARRMFLECARWPDDARRTTYDHPTWHAALWPVVAADTPAETRARLARRGDGSAGEGLQALALNYGVLADPRASASERALAMCWTLHVAGDLHQPLHAGELFSAAYPDGDGGGSRQFVKDPLTGEPVALHWLWDDSVHRSGVAASVDQRARELEARHPRASFKQLNAAKPLDFAWVRDESHALAMSFAFGAHPPTEPTEAAAPAVPDAYWQRVRQHGEARVALAGYRIADLVVAALDASKR